MQEIIEKKKNIPGLEDFRSQVDKIVNEKLYRILTSVD